MNCYNHTDEESISTCQECETGLCIECDTKYDIALCDGCKLEDIKKRRIKFLIGIAATVIVFFLVYSSIDTRDREQAFIVATVAAFLAFSLTRGLEDFKLALANKTFQKSYNMAIIEARAKAIAKGENPLPVVILGWIILIALYPMYVSVYSIGSLFREMKALKSDYNAAKLIS